MNAEKNLIDSLNSISALKISEAEVLPEKTYMPLIAVQKSLTIDVAVTAPTSRQIVAFHGEPMTVKVICAILKLFNDGLNTTLQMSPRQLFEYAQIWLDTFPNETIKDLILCLKRAKAGSYGPIFNRVDGSVVSTFFREYLEEKAYWREQQNRQYISDQIAKEPPLVKMLPQEQQKALGELMKKPNLRSTSVDTMPNHEQYIKWLKDNVTELENDVLLELSARAGKKGVKEVSALVEAELDRRRQLMRDSGKKDRAREESAEYLRSREGIQRLEDTTYEDVTDNDIWPT